MNATERRAILSLLTIAMLFGAVNADAGSSLIIVLCGIVGGIQAIIGILALALFLIGGVMYAIAHFLPTSLDYRKSLVGWSTAMITGGIIGLIVVLLAPLIVQLVANLGGAAGGSAISISTSCSGVTGSGSGGSGGTGGSGGSGSKTCAAQNGVCAPVRVCSSCVSSTPACPATQCCCTSG